MGCVSQIRAVCWSCPGALKKVESVEWTPTVNIQHVYQISVCVFLCLSIWTFLCLSHGCSLFPALRLNFARHENDSTANNLFLKYDTPLLDWFSKGSTMMKKMEAQSADELLRPLYSKMHLLIGAWTIWPFTELYQQAIDWQLLLPLNVLMMFMWSSMCMDKW